ncbi:TlpA disulfide reductase family protein [Sphingobacterium yanglingense]|uniref:Thiol-disulfide isomerase/thioredoxin n=1 Tax=Sphingobacterium yanglingense TaxID=1437280 RepID=A0A4R6WIA1_9SPHI|nr:TlpA disulfide reductase family protein [Sphingobacterium yanglingense]TDQ78127.1 thiol-disulfide isomerase/thioredoxin [Sphingobacterium yanglingense]
MRILGIIILSVFALAMNAHGQKQYTINGYLPGYKYSKIYLRKAHDVDSTIVKNGRFVFRGTVSEPTSSAFSDRKEEVRSFILEGGTYTITGDSSLNTAQMTGAGPTELQRLALEQSKEPINQKLKLLESQMIHQLTKKDTAAAIKTSDEMRSLFSDLDKIDMDFIVNHPKSFLSFFMIWIMSQVDDPAKAHLLYDKLDPSVKNSAVGKRGKAAFDKQRAVAVGSQALDFTESDINGKPFTLSSLQGKYVFLDFWASWCGPCRAEHPALKQAYENFKDEAFTIVSVSLDRDKDLWLNAIKNDGLPTWHHVSDLKGFNSVSAELYSISAIPFNILIDPEGIIIAKNLRGEDLENSLNQIFRK